MIPYSKQKIDQDDIDLVIDILKSDYLTQGPMVDKFEEALAKYLGVKYVLALNSATSALHIAYSALEIPKNSEILTSPISFVATSNMAIVENLNPIFIDVKLDGNIEERFIQKHITPKTKAIVPVHYSGNMCNMDEIVKIAKKNNLYIIEDAAHAFGSEYNQQKAGTFGDFGVFSFHAIKPITTGEGGALVTNNKELYTKAKLLRSHGITKKILWNFDMDQMGFNYRMSDINAALGFSQLKKLDTFIQRREEIAKIYDNAFKNNKYFYTIDIPKNIKTTRHLYPILLKQEFYCPKEDIFEAMQQKGLGVQVHYKPIYKNSFYEKKYGFQSLFGAEEFYKAQISLPCHQDMSDSDVEYVIKSIFEIFKEHNFRCRSF